MKRGSDTLIESIIMFVILGSVGLAIQYSYYYFIITFIALVSLILYNRYKLIKEKNSMKEIVRDKWGKEHLEKRDFHKARQLFDLLNNNDKFFIDNITWNDLNMDSVFSKVDHTKSFPGMHYLYYILRNPLFNRTELDKRKETINYLLHNNILSLDLQFQLLKLGKEKGENIIDFFINGINTSTKKLPIFTFLSYMPFISLIVLIFNKPIGFFLIILTVAVNSLLYESNKNNIYEEMHTFKYISTMITCAKELNKIIDNKVYLKQDELGELLKKTRFIAKNISKINYNESSISEAQIIMHAYNMIMFREPKVFYKTIRYINQHKEDFLEMYKIIGEIDAYLSITSYKDSLEYFTEPEFIETKSEYCIKAGDIYHPLLEKPVPYSIEFINNGALVTGSNASGKSTFLRTIGINSLFAQTLNLVLAKEYSTSYFKLLTSIGTTDSIVEGDSYFMAEAKSLKRIIDELDVSQPVLCILDEIFRGTNTAERISAASEALEYMINLNCCVLAATHDLELTRLVNDGFRNYHFMETIDNNDIYFDYILRTGPCTSRNAIAILKYLGYPDEIYQRSRKKAEEYITLV